MMEEYYQQVFFYGNKVIKLDNGMTLHCNNDHPIATLNSYGTIEWKKAVNISSGEEIFTSEGSSKCNFAIKIDLGEGVMHDFYDIEIPSVSQFYANGILVHNKKVLDGPIRV